MIIKQQILILLLMVCVQSVFPQINEDFGDGNFTQNPVWMGSTNQFTVNSSNQLQLNASGEGIAFLSTENAICNSTEWRFWVKLGFSPSSNNMARIYLVSNLNDVSGSLQGYYLQLGEAGSLDAIELFRQQGTSSVSVCRGTPGFLSSSFAISVKVTRNENGLWQVFADASGGSNFQLQAEGTDTQVNTTSWFGWYCKYTSSNSTKFYLDNIYVGPIQADTVPPVLLSVEMIGTQQLKLLFNEALDATMASDPRNFNVNNGIGDAVSAIYESSDPLIVQLSFATPFLSGTNYRVSVVEIADKSGNSAYGLYKNFSVFEAGRYDVLISEIMADPDPTVGLPNFEYIELVNKSGFNLQLKGWQLKTGNVTKTLPDFELAADAYVLLCRPEAIPELSPFSVCVPVSSLQITNSGQSLQLLDANNQLIHEVSFNDSWYGDTQKKNGGWSLEMIDPQAVCLGAENWKASTDASGGSPGMENSVNASIAIDPTVLMVYTLSDSSLQVLFNQNMDALSLESNTHYSVEPAIGNPVFTEIPGLSSVILHFTQKWVAGIEYRLNFSQGIVNCKGVSLPAAYSIAFRKALPASSYDILITEVMPDPDPPVGLPNFEYIELYNAAEYPINLGGWRLINGNSVLRFSQCVMAPDSRLILGHQNATAELSAYGLFYGFSSFSLTNTGTSLALYSAQGTMIHSISYDPAMYYPSAKANGGWSLEITDIDNPCSSSNWQASVNPLGGTPGAVNSVLGAYPDIDPPKPLRVYVSDANHISLSYNENCDSLSISSPSMYSIEPEIGNASESIPQAYDFRKVDLKFEIPLEEGKVYHLKIKPGATDCAGNTLNTTTDIDFGLPSVCSVGDVVFNEILTNPPADAPDYLELYNRSKKVVDLASLGLTYQSLTSSSSPKTVFLPTYLLMPGVYYCLTRNPESILTLYQSDYPQNFVVVGDLPDFTSDSALLTLHLKESLTDKVDYLKYSIQMHHPLLKDLDGIALERVNPDISTNTKGNWQSAAEARGFGSPADVNSQYMNEVVAKGSVSISPEIFSPDSDGRDDVLQIKILPPDAGFIANVRIFESSGRLVKNLAQNLSVGNEAILFWDGISDSRQKAPMGMYLLFTDLFHIDGRRERHKTLVIVGHQL